MKDFSIEDKLNAYKAFLKATGGDDCDDDPWSHNPYEAFITGKPYREEKPTGYRAGRELAQTYLPQARKLWTTTKKTYLQSGCGMQGRHWATGTAHQTAARKTMFL